MNYYSLILALRKFEIVKDPFSDFCIAVWYILYHKLSSAVVILPLILSTALKIQQGL